MFSLMKENKGNILLRIVRERPSEWGNCSQEKAP